MNPTDAFAWVGIGCNCLLLLVLGLLLALWALSPRVEGSYVERPQRDRTDRRKRAPAAAAQPRREPPATKQPQPPRETPAAPQPESLLSAVLAEAHRAAEAIGDIQIAIPTTSGTEFEIQVPDVAEALSSQDPWTQIAQTVQVTAGKETYEGMEAIAEAGTRAAVEQVAERVEQAVPAARPVTQEVKAVAREASSPLAAPTLADAVGQPGLNPLSAPTLADAVGQPGLNPLSAPTLADGIEIILQDLIRREAEPLRQMIHVESTDTGGVRIVVGDRVYLSVSEVPEGRARKLLQQAVQHWNRLWQERDRNAR